MQRKRLLHTVITAGFLLIVVSCGAGCISKPDTGTSSAGTLAAAATASVMTASPPAAIQQTGEPSAYAGKAAVELYPAGLDLPAGRSIALTANGSMTTSGGQAEWTSSDPAVVSVSQDGTVTALSPGESLITLTAGGSSGVCRVTVTAGGTALAYPEDPGPLNQDGGREPSGSPNGNFPVVIPDDQKKVDKSFFEDAEYAWQFIIDDGFDTQLKVPNTSIAYMVNYHVSLDARRKGGDAPLGDYTGTMKMDMAIDTKSFLSAMKAAGIPATDMSSALKVQNVDIAFSVVTCDADKLNAAKYAFVPAGQIPVVPLIQPFAMAISSAETSTSGNLDLQIEEGFGSAALSGASGSIPLVLEVSSDGRATLHLPRLLSACGRDRFEGVLARMRLLDLPG